MPTKRNALMVFLIPTICFIAAPPLGAALGTTAFRFAPNAAILAGFLIFAMHAKAMVAELNAATGGKFVWWHLLIPVYGLFLAVTAIPKQMAEAKQKAQAPAPRGAVLYLFLFLFAFASDLNDVAK